MKRVVITGLGVCAPNGIGVPEFTEALKNGKSGISHFKDLEDLKFSCQIGGMPSLSEEKLRDYFTELQLRNFKSNVIAFGVIAGMDALKDAGILVGGDKALYDLGIIMGSGGTSATKFRESLYKIDEKKVKRLGSTAVIQIMASGVSAYLGGMTGAANMVTTNSSACATGTESVILGYERIKAGKATQMLCGSTGEGGPYIWGGFDAMRVMSYKHNDKPGAAAGPMSDNASGFIPGSGAGAVVLESLESAIARGAKIYGEIVGGAINSGGQRNGGSMTAPNSEAVQRCVKDAVKEANIDPNEIDYINGHLTATVKDPVEIENWCKALNRNGNDFPYINSLKGMTGHCLAASGSIEIVSTILQMDNNFIFPNINCDTIHPEITKLIPEEKIPRTMVKSNINTAIKASFGFGDVNACIVFKKYKQ
ncbi:3-oxoacyl-[acyl-carrier-protein] synthase [unidentified eubacterium SCB49]|nr:3-oxoacyl-[acyl-carrier-protein] synthase [unidentified eubacterium SCB49]